jgi:hypothetical protein
MKVGSFLIHAPSIKRIFSSTREFGTTDESKNLVKANHEHLHGTQTRQSAFV